MPKIGPLFVFNSTTPDEISKIVMKFKNKKCSTDKIPISILKKVIDIISPILAEIFNESIELGVFPNKLKLGRVIPLHKSGTQNSILNFRPITTLSVFSKIFEKLVHNRMLKFINKFGILNQNQFGFRKSRNTADAILEFLDNTYDSFNDNKFLLAVFLDFSKAFDTINHSILMSKLEFMGFRGPIYSWLKSYLENRKQYVDLNGTFSDIRNVTLGVPQGSTLGPLLFLLYINDMKNSLRALDVLHFADDSTLYMKFRDNISDIVNDDLNFLQNWLNTNKLFLNVKKTKYMILSKRAATPNLDLKIGASCIEKTDAHKFLGIYIDQHLTFKEHTKNLCSKISSSVGLLRKINYFVPPKVLRQLHFALIHSKFTYAITAYGSANQNALQKLVNFINKSIKIVTSSHRVTLDVCKSEKIFDFHLAHRYASCLKMFQINKLEMHSYFLNKINAMQTDHSYRTRMQLNEELNTPLFRSLKCQKSFLYVGIKYWNDLPVNIRNSGNIKIFKKCLQSHLFS